MLGSFTCQGRLRKSSDRLACVDGRDDRTPLRHVSNRAKRTKAHLPARERPGGAAVVATRDVLALYSIIRRLLVASGVLIRSRCLRMLGRLQPGHWLVLILATGGILACVARSCCFAQTLASTCPLARQYQCIDADFIASRRCGGSFRVCSHSFAGCRTMEGSAGLRRSRFLLPRCAVHAIMVHTVFPEDGRVLSQVHTGVCRGGSLIVAVIAVVVLALDWPHRVTRDWAHWLGASLWTLGSVADCVYEFALYAR